MSFSVRFPALRIERQFAEGILSGRKLWEVRKRPLPLFRDILLCDVARGGAARVVGSVSFSLAVWTMRPLLRNSIAMFRDYYRRAGFTDQWLREYAGDTELVFAHLVSSVSRFEITAYGSYSNGKVEYLVGTREAAEKMAEMVAGLVRANDVPRYDLRRR